MSQSKKKGGKGFYDHMIAWLRRGFALAAVGLTAVVVLWPTLQDEEVSFTLSYEDTTPTSDKIRMEDLHYVGTDLGGRRFEISADKGVQSSPEAPSIRLEGIRANVEMNEARTVELVSGGGTYYVEENILEMDGGVVMTTTDGYQFSAGAARFNLDTNQADSEAQISGQGPLGSFTADSFQIHVDEKLVIFEGNVEMRLYPRGS